MKRLGLFVLLCLISVPALADPTSDAKAHSEAFERAANARDTKAVMALYADGARVIWPGQGEEATGKAEKAAILKRDVVGPKPPVSRVTSAEEGLLVSLDRRGAVDRHDPRRGDRRDRRDADHRAR